MEKLYGELIKCIIIVFILLNLRQSSSIQHFNQERKIHATHLIQQGTPKAREIKLARKPIVKGNENLYLSALSIL